MNELSKLKVFRTGDKWILNEVSKKQRELLNKLRVDDPTTHDVNNIDTKS